MGILIEKLVKKNYLYTVMTNRRAKQIIPTLIAMIHQRVYDFKTTKNKHRTTFKQNPTSTLQIWLFIIELEDL